MSISHIHRLRVLRFDDESSTERNHIANDVKLKKHSKSLVKNNTKKLETVADKIVNQLKEEYRDFRDPSSAVVARGNVEHETANVNNAVNSIPKIRKHNETYHKSNKGIYKIPPKRKMRTRKKNKQIFENTLNFDDVKRLLSLKGNEYSEQFLNALYRALSKDKDNIVEMGLNKRKKLKKHRHKRNKNIDIIFAPHKAMLIKEARKQYCKSRRRRVALRPSYNIFQNGCRHRSKFTPHKLLKVKSAPNYGPATNLNAGLSKKKTINLFRKDDLYTSSSVFSTLMSSSDQENLGKRGVYFGDRSFKKQYNPASSFLCLHRKISDNWRILRKSSYLFTDNHPCCKGKEKPVASHFSLHRKESSDQERRRKRNNLNKPFPDNPIIATPRNTANNPNNNKYMCNASDDQKNSVKRINVVTCNGKDKQVKTTSSIFHVSKKGSDDEINRINFRVNSYQCSPYNSSIFRKLKKDSRVLLVNKRGNYKDSPYFLFFRNWKKELFDQKDRNKYFKNKGSRCQCLHHNSLIFRTLKNEPNDNDHKDVNKHIGNKNTLCQCSRHNSSIFRKLKKESSVQIVNKRGNYKDSHYFPLFRNWKKELFDQKDVSKYINNKISQCQCSHHNTPIVRTIKKEPNDQKNVNKHISNNGSLCECLRHNSSIFRKSKKESRAQIVNKRGDYKGSNHFPLFRNWKKYLFDQKDGNKHIGNNGSLCQCSQHNSTIFRKSKKKSRGNYKGSHYFPYFRNRKKRSFDQMNACKLNCKKGSQCQCSRHKLCNERYLNKNISICECPYYRILRKPLKFLKNYLQYILLVLLIIAWSPCIVVICLWWLVTSFKLNLFKEKDNECKKYCTHNRKNTVSHKVYTTQVYNAGEDTKKFKAEGTYIKHYLWTDVRNRVKRTKQAIVSLFGSICCCFTNIYKKNSHYYVLPEKKTKGNQYPQVSSSVPPPRTSTPRAYPNVQFNDPNPKKEYKLFYGNNRGWLIKPIRTRFNNYDFYKNNKSKRIFKNSSKTYFCGDPCFSKNYAHATTKIPSCEMYHRRCNFKYPDIHSNHFNCTCRKQRRCQDRVPSCTCSKRSCKQRFISYITYPVRRLKRIIEEVDTQAIPKVDPCEDAFLFSLRKKPKGFSLFIYNICPNLYPCYVITIKQLKNLMNVLLGCLCICVWSPIVCCCYIFYIIFSLVCCI